MKALLVLYAGGLAPEAFQPVINGKSGFALAIERAEQFSGAAKTIILAGADFSAQTDFTLPANVTVETRSSWTKRSLLETIAEKQQGFDFAYFAWADCPFLDPALAGKIAEHHVRYAAEYSYADGWPYGLSPELLAPGTAAVLAKILGDDDGGAVDRGALFSVIQKDINAFDIEAEIASVDLRCHRLNLCADSKRNLLLLRRFAENGIPDAASVEKAIIETPAILRTLPNFFPIQVSGGCPQSCALCPYPKISPRDITTRKDCMDAARFESLLDKIVSFSGDAVIDLSLWGEIALHPEKMRLIEAVLKKPRLALVIETSGIGWQESELEKCAEMSRNAALYETRTSPLPPLSWIVSLDTLDQKRYTELRGAGFAEAMECAKKLPALFPKDTYIQAVRTSGAEDDIENFYRTWKNSVGAENIIIQKYNDFCGFLPRKQASDISPVKREPCWHIMRDMPVLIDGTVPLCSAALPEEGVKNNRVMGNVFTDSLETIWERGNQFYLRQCEKKYDGSCAVCDEYYTYNF